ncbi:hypothetical protein VFSR5_2745 [Aliivibrio fischeri SR5]|uniref:Uncharacterized protein n=1 Tax=Aliivibrio fischeri SR5 TaxID=1088719 RepID=A0AAV3EMF8_ALIFS|nr:hypothetical protein VFSR5_2745 [Aliivibrio fischeri SR5]
MLKDKIEIVINILTLNKCNYKNLTNASTRFATLGILGFFEFAVLSGKF